MPRIPSVVSTDAQGTVSVAQLRGTPAPIQQSKDRQINDLQRQQAEANQGIKALPFGDGNLFRDVTFASSTNKVIRHGLGRAYQGFMAINARTNVASIYRPGTNTDGDLANVQITLISDNDTLADIWIF